MCKKLIYLISFGLVLGVAGSASADLVAHWKFDEGSGDTAFDSSGNDYHATLVNNPVWVQGKLGGALNLDAGGYGGIQGLFYQGSGIPEVSVCAWVRTSSTGAQFIASFDRNEYWRLAIGSTNAAVSAGQVGWHVQTDAGMNDYASDRRVDDGQWHHVCGVFDNGTATIYIDGEPEPSTTQGSTFGRSTLRYGYIGKNSEATVENQAGPGGNPLDGDLDDLRIYDHALTQAEIKQVMKGIPPGAASDPSPEHETTDVPREVVLNWTPGEFAPPVNGHKVYLSENFDDVNDGIGGITQSAGSYDPPGRLDFGKTYYWRIDEVNGPPDYTVYKGPVWQFTTEPFVYAVENIVATASSSFDADTGPEKTVDGSGLDADDLHSVEQTDIWLTSVTAQPPIWIQYEFDKVYKLHEMWVWNFNQVFEFAVGFGLKDVTIEYSANGADWAELPGVPEFAQAPGMPGYAHNTTVDFGGAAAKYVKITVNDNWGFLTQYGLSEVRFLYIAVLPREPNPDSGATDVPLDATLSFRAGREAAKHDVYFGTDEQAVIDGTAPATTVTEASHGPLPLDLGKTYYWRVDEVNEAETPTTWQGDIWNFATQEYFVLEDFEAYDDYEPNRIFDTWVDGWGVATNGATMGYPNPVFVQDEHFVETMIRHGGSQSTPLFYENTAGVTYSEASRTVDTTKDWTQADVKTLTLWFYGDWTNVPAQVYAKVDGVKVTYDGDMSDVQKPSWHQWDIELASLAGVNLRNVNQITIGVEGGGSGVVYLDDIRLYSSRCVASRLQPQADLNDDCVVDYQDLDILSSDWLVTDDVIATVVPSEANKELHLKFDGSLLDSSPNGRSGYIMPATATVTYLTGKAGQAIYLDGSNYVEMTGYKGILDANPFSVAAWIRTTDDEGEILGWGFDSGGQHAEFRVNDNRLRCEHGNGNVQGDTNVTDGEWHHVAVTVIENATISHPDVILYLDGRDDTIPTTDPDVFNVNTDYDVKMGQRYELDNTRWFTGLVDDVRLYSRTLSGAEVAYLADATPGDGQLYVPVSSAAELSSGEPEGSKVIDLKDYAIFGDQWLDEQFWPAP